MIAEQLKAFKDLMNSFLKKNEKAYFLSFIKMILGDLFGLLCLLKASQEHAPELASHVNTYL